MSELIDRLHTVQRGLSSLELTRQWNMGDDLAAVQDAIDRITELEAEVERLKAENFTAQTLWYRQLLESGE